MHNPGNGFSEPRPYWGLFGTIFWGFSLLVLIILTQAIAFIVYVVATSHTASQQQLLSIAQSLQADGTVLSVCTFATTIVGGLALLVVIKLKRGSEVKEYLGLVLPTKRQALMWGLIMSIFIVGSDTLTVALKKSVVPEFMTKAYGSAHPVWLLWIALLLAAPLLEELFFRGFLIKGLAASALNWYGAIILSSLLWAAIHLQYGLYEIGSIFCMGLILGAARIKTGSTILTIALHAYANLVAIIEVVIHRTSL